MTVQAGISKAIPVGVMYTAMFIGGLVVAIVRHWRLGLVVFSVIPVIMLAGGTCVLFLSPLLACRKRKRLMDQLN